MPPTPHAFRPRARAALLTTCAAVLAAGPARAEEQWLAYEAADAAGRVFGQLRFGEPETDALTVAATCPGATPDRIDLSLFVDTGDVVAGDPATVRIATPAQAEARPGAVVADQFGRHAIVHLAADDPIWGRLADGLTATIGVAGADQAEIHLRGSRAAIHRFLQSCAALPAAAAAAHDATPAAPEPSGDPSAAQPDADGDADAAAPDDTPVAEGMAANGSDTATADKPSPPAYPLYVTGPDPVPAFSAVRFGVALPPIPPGTTVQRVGGHVTREGHAWAQVTTRDDRARTVWVERSALEPPRGGARYQNPSDTANLLIREAPAPDAAVVGSIPPRAVGIEAQGAEQGDWVQVRFGDMMGWVSYLHLQPRDPAADEPDTGIETAAATGAAGDGAGSPGPARPYNATHGAWTVDCDPCRDPQVGPACRTSAESTATVRRRATLALAPAGDDGSAEPLQLVYRADAALPGPPDASLALTIDGAAPRTVPADGWSLDPDSGDAVVTPQALTGLLPGLGAGAHLTLSVSDGARNWVDQFVLTGLGASLADMTARLPMPSRHGDPDACPADVPDDPPAE